MNAPARDIAAGVLWTRDEAARATGGQASGRDWTAFGLSIDSRTLEPEDLFVALAGPNHDGHDHVGDALAKGAAAALVQRTADGLDPEAPMLTVADSQEGLRALAAAARLRTRAKLVAVTGSVGKTGTKEMLRLALSAAGETHASEGNLNNHLGVPLSLARLPRDAEFAVFEIGMNHPGEIGPLSMLTRPEVAVITAIAPAHLEFFATPTDIARAKAEIFQGVTPGGTAILPRDTPYFDILRDAAKAVGIKRIATFGSRSGCDARLLEARVDAEQTHVLTVCHGRTLSYRLGVPGRHWAINSLAVLLAAEAVGVAPERSATTLVAMTAPKGRGARHSVPWRGGSVLVIDESYNASPAAVEAAFASLAATRPGPGGRRIAVLGDMLELGPAAPALHVGLAKGVTREKVDLVFTAGPLMRYLHDAIPPASRGKHGEDAAAAARHLVEALMPGDVVMVKGSASTGMGRVIEALGEAAGEAAAADVPAAGR